MRRILQFGLAAVLTLVSLAGAAHAQSRNALVIGNAAYENAPSLKTPITNAAIVAETLRAAGYAVTELQNVRQANIGQSMRDFLDKIAAGGPDGIAFFYYSGHAAQSGGENYLIPVDAVIGKDSDVENEAFRLKELLDALTATPSAARIVVLDAARDHKLGSTSGKPVAKGLAMSATTPGSLLAFAAAPGTLAIDGNADYSIYTGALVSQMRQPGLDIEQIFKTTRRQVNLATEGAQTPWTVSGLTVDVTLFAAPVAEPMPAAPPPAAAVPKKKEQRAQRTKRERAAPAETQQAAPPAIMGFPGGISIGGGGISIDLGR
jgi:uncharacterized caspase-like protein